jgi:hypothetical protein
MTSERVRSRGLFGALANGLVNWLWPDPAGPAVHDAAAAATRQGASGYYDLPAYRRRAIRIAELEREG